MSRPRVLLLSLVALLVVLAPHAGPAQTGPSKWWGQWTSPPGFLYLAVVVDAWSRRVVGWSMASHLRTELVLDALEMAVMQRRPRDVNRALSTAEA